MFDFHIFYIVFLVFFFIIIIGLICLDVIISTEKIDPKQCPVILSDFAIQTGKNVKIKNKCGNTATEPCSFQNVQDIESAISKCNALFETCNAFTYSTITNVMNIVEPSENVGDYVVYLRQL